MTDILLLTWARALELARDGRPRELALLIRDYVVPETCRTELAELIEDPPSVRIPRVTRKLTDAQVPFIRDLVRALTSKATLTVNEIDDGPRRMTKTERDDMRKLLKRLPLSYDDIAAGLGMSAEVLRDVAKGRHSYAAGSKRRANSPNKRRK